MLSLIDIAAAYPVELQGFERLLIREYLQYKILQIIFDESAHAAQLSFLGGTCLRIVHGNQRFSEDLDFDNFDMSEEHFETISQLIDKSLTREGYQVEIKNVYKGAYHCYIRFPKLLYWEGLSGHQEEKLLIQLDTESQHFVFTPERYIINRFDVFTEILVTPVDILLSQKFYAILNRKRNKGRDFYDAVFLLGITKPNYDYLELKLGINNSIELKTRLLAHCNTLDMDEMARDVAPFLFKPSDEKKIKLFTQYLAQVAL